MREESRFARKSVGRNQRRTFYDSYINSPEWRQRRETWVVAQKELLATTELHCLGCDALWKVERDDLHHRDYDRLGDEDHSDLWPLCRGCHTNLHTVLDSFRGYKRMRLRQANSFALAALQNSTADHGIGALRAAL